MTEIKNEIATAETNLLSSLSNSNLVAYCSFKPENEDDEVLLFNAANNPDEKLKDYVNMPIMLKHVYAEMVDLINDKTGEPFRSTRIVLIDDKGKSYSCVSKGVFNAIKKIFALKGTPETWNKPVKIVPIIISKGTDSNTLSIKLVK